MGLYLLFSAVTGGIGGLVLGRLLAAVLIEKVFKESGYLKFVWNNLYQAIITSQYEQFLKRKEEKR